MNTALPVPPEMSNAVFEPTVAFLECLGVDLLSPRDERLLRIDLDRGRRVVGMEFVAAGTKECVAARAADIYRGALRVNAAAVVLVHNHPSGNPLPGRVDIDTTQRLRLVGELLRIDLLDHIIVATGGLYSFRREGRL